MSLTQQQKQNTINEFHENLNLTGFSIELVAHDLHTTEARISDIMSLTVDSIEDPWILKNYLLEILKKQGKKPVLFTALKGDYHDYWFLDFAKIDKKSL